MERRKDRLWYVSTMRGLMLCLQLSMPAHSLCPARCSNTGGAEEGEQVLGQSSATG